jgi:hypothetical protein
VAAAGRRGQTGSLPDDAQPARPRIGRYVIVGRIGRGGMGMVYRGLDEALEREVAVKTLTGEGTLDEESRRRFEIEAKAAARLQHPNIVTVYELGQERGTPFIAMELLPGGDLETLLRSGEALPLAEKLDVAIQVCRGLGFAHDHKIVHRDVKPSNIRLLDDGTVKIMDFGIAKLGSTSVTRAGMMVGTMNYMSPEQIRGLPLDGRSDVFSLGVILYQMLTGRRPFVGKGTDVLYKIVQEETPPLGVDLGPETAALQAVVNRALAKDPAQRYASAAELARDLEGVLTEHRRSRAQPLPAPAEQALANARTAWKAGRFEETLQRLQPLVAAAPDWLEARRLLRAARREQQRKLQPAEPSASEFPELDATFQASPTQRAAQTVSAQTTAAAPRGVPALPWLAGGAALLVLAGVTIGLLLFRRSAPEPASRPPAQSRTEPSPIASPQPQEAAAATPLPVPVSAAVKPPAAAAPILVSVAVESEPAGAAVSVDGRRAGATPAEIRIDAAREHVVTLAREGYKTQELKIAAGRAPSALRLALEPAGPPGSLSIVSSYPVEVLSRGKSLAKGRSSPTLSLAPGTHALTIVSAEHFLKREVVVEVKPGGSSGLQLPGLGKINIRANPDNCEVFIDGVFVDYPPILNRAIAEGTHTITFKWPDGAKRDQTAQVASGGIAWVTGKKD